MEGGMGARREGGWVGARGRAREIWTKDGMEGWLTRCTWIDRIDGWINGEGMEGG